MERVRIIKDDVVEQGQHFLAVYMETKNSCLILFSEKEDRLGTLVVAVPGPKDMLGPPISSVLLGDKNAVSARMFAEYMAAKKGKIALVSIYLETVGETQAQSIFKRLIESIIHTEANTEQAAA